MPRKPAKPAPKKRTALPERLPNLPDHNLPAPYAALMRLGGDEYPESYLAVADALRATDPIAGAKRLSEIALDARWYAYIDLDKFPEESDPFQYETRLNMPVHAIRTLTELGEAAHPHLEALLPLLASEDEVLAEDMTYFYAEMGEQALPLLVSALQNAEIDPHLRIGASDALSELGEQNPDLKSECVVALSEVISNPEEDPEIAAYFVVALLNLGATEAYPVIAAAYAEERIESGVVSLAEVQEHFGMPVTAERYAAMPFEGEEEDLWDGEEDDNEEAPTEPEARQEPFVSGVKAGRNDPCPCGSGKKYKKCCGSAAP